MTSKVTIEAHCADNKNVVVTLNDLDKEENFYIQNGEKMEFYIYDHRSVTTSEQLKEE